MACAAFSEHEATQEGQLRRVRSQLKAAVQQVAHPRPNPLPSPGAEPQPQPLAPTLTPTISLIQVASLGETKGRLQKQVNLLESKLQWGTALMRIKRYKDTVRSRALCLIGRDTHPHRLSPSRSRHRCAGALCSS